MLVVIFGVILIDIAEQPVTFSRLISKKCLLSFYVRTRIFSNLTKLVLKEFYLCYIFKDFCEKTSFFRLFPIISISQIFLIIWIFIVQIGEKIGIDEKVICYHNISNLLWKKDVLCVWKRSESQKHYKFSALWPRICKLFSRFTFFPNTKNIFFPQ